MAFKGNCACCKEFKSLYYALGTPQKHCIACHKLGYPKVEPTRRETTTEYLARLAQRIAISPPQPPVILPPPRANVPRVAELTATQQAARKELEALAERKRISAMRPGLGTDAALDELRLNNRKLMDQRRENYTPRRSLTPLQPPK